MTVPKFRACRVCVTGDCSPCPVCKGRQSHHRDCSVPVLGCPNQQETCSCNPAELAVLCESAPDLRALRELAEGARMWFPAEDHDGMDEVPWMDAEWWHAVGLDDHHAQFSAAANPTAVLALLDRLEAAEAAVERVRGQRFCVEVACDGFAALVDDDVPDEWIGLELDAYRAGATEAANQIRAALDAD